MKSLLLSILLAITFFLPCVDAQVRADPLKGVKAVMLDLTVDKTLTGAGVDESGIRNSIEVKLRNTGLVILTSPPAAGEANIKSWVPLSIAAEGLKVADTNTYCYDCRANVSEIVYVARKFSPTPGLARVESVAFAATWSTSSLGYFGSARSDAVKGALDDIADVFCNAYLTANPKPSVVAPDPPPPGNAFTLPGPPK